MSSIAIDPSDPTGNRVYVGTTGGGVWLSQNAGTAGSVIFTPLTDAPAAFDAVRYASISIGAVSVQPGGTGVILAGTGDPNDALNSYYGAGVLRSPDGGNTWTVMSHTADQMLSFQGEGFAGFAWSTVNPQVVVAAVSQAYEGTLVSAQLSGVSYAGLYYSTDAGATWSLATINDSPGQDVQGPLDLFASPNGNSATAVIWNPVRHIFIAAVRFHGYYQSSDGVTWTRMTAQPGSGMTTQMCPTNPGTIGSLACPIFRGALAVNPLTGDTFAWTVDVNNQDQGIWQDACSSPAEFAATRRLLFRSAGAPRRSKRTPVWVGPRSPTNVLVSLSGTGFDFSVSSSGQSSQTVSSGQTASFSIKLATMSGSSGTFTFACSGLPANSACTFNPASEVVTANASGSATVQIATGVSSTSAQNGDLRGRVPRGLLFACGLLLMPFAFRRRRRSLFLMVVLLRAPFGIASCAGAGGGGSGAPPVSGNKSTPAGTYPVVVTATANGLSHKITLNLTVD